MKIQRILAVLFVWMMPSAAFGAELLVPDDYLTLQEAVSAAQNGDEIVITDDLYGPGNHEIYIYKHLTIHGNNHFIDLSGDYYGFYLSGANLVINDLSFLNGLGSQGSPSGGSLVGGAMKMFDSTVVLEGCRFENCSASTGGAIYAIRCNLSVNECQFIGNYASTIGAGINFSASNGIGQELIVTNTTFELNQSGDWVAGIWALGHVEKDVVRIEGCKFLHNESLQGIATFKIHDFSVVEVSRNVIAENSGSSTFEISDGKDINFSNNIVYRNAGIIAPGGKFNHDTFDGAGSMTIRSNTFYENGNDTGSAPSHVSISTSQETQQDTIVANNIIYSSNLRGVDAVSSSPYASIVPMSRNCLSGPKINWSTDDIYANPILGLKLMPNKASPCVDSAAGNWAAQADFFNNQRYDVGRVPNTGTGTTDFADIGAVEYVEKEKE